MLSGVSFVMFFIMTQYLSDPHLYQYWYALIPYFIIGLYAGKHYVVCTAVAAIVICCVNHSSTSELLLSITYILITTIVCIMMHHKYHQVQYIHKLILLFGGIILAGSINSMVFLQSSLVHLLQNFQFHLWEYAVSTVMYVCTIIITFTLVIRQNESEQMLNFYQVLEKNYRTELNVWGQLLRFAPYAVLSVSANEEITYANERAFVKYTSLKRLRNNKIKQGQKLSSIMRDECYTEISEMIQNVFARKASVCTNQNSEDRCFLITVFPIMSSTDQTIISVSIYLQDITELQMLRNEVDHIDRLNLVGQMAASITHEIRNPMAVIRGFVQLLQEKSNNLHKQYYSIIIEELDRANGIITDFLGLAKLNNGAKENLQLNKVIDEISPLLIADANFRGQTIEFCLEDQLPQLSINEREIKQLLLNIARNAMEAMEERGNLLICTANQGDGVLLSVVDEGPGIPDEMKVKIFEPFFSSKNNGTGLGLPLCADIAKRHNAHIEVLDNKSHGSIFNIRFPLNNFN